MKMVKVVWRDSGIQHTDGWSKIDEIVSMTKISNVTTVGVLAHKTEDTMYIGLSFDPDHNNYFGVQGIYIPDIISLEYLMSYTSGGIDDDGPEAC